MSNLIGKKVKVKKNIEDHSDFWENCVTKNAEYLIITGCEVLKNSVNNIYHWEAYDKDGKKLVYYCSGHHLTENDFIPYNRTIEDVQYGDVVVDRNNYYRNVLGRCDGIVFLSDFRRKGEKGEEERNNYVFTTSIQELKNNGYTLANQETTDIIEVNGKKYDKEKLIERLKDLPEVE
jgi:hypothetical protein